MPGRPTPQELLAGVDAAISAQTQDDGPDDDELGEVPPMALAVPEKPAPPADTAKYMSLREMRELAQIALASRLVKVSNPDEAVIKMLFGREMGLGPMFSLKHLYVVNNTPALSAGVIGALIKKHPAYDYRIVEHDDDHCILVFYQDGESVGRSEFSIADARKAGLTGKEVWQKYPRNMLLSRALTNGARWYCPDVFNGPIYTPEELSVDVGMAQDDAEPAQYREIEEPKATGPVDMEKYIAGRVDYPVGAEPDYVRSAETCPLHGELFFKRGKMKSHAHKVGASEWCNYKDVIGEFSKRASQGMEDFGHSTPDDKEAAARELMPDLEGVPVTQWRIVDWALLADTFGTQEEAAA